MICSGANGLGLALVIPATQSLIADLYPPEARGRAFGLLLLFSGIGARPRA
jgi:MFS family permease